MKSFERVLCHRGAIGVGAVWGLGVVTLFVTAAHEVGRPHLRTSERALLLVTGPAVGAVLWLGVQLRPARRRP